MIDACCGEETRAAPSSTIQKGKASTLAAAVRNRQRASSALARSFLEGVAALRAWMIEHTQGDFVIIDVVERCPIEELLAEPMVAAWEVPLARAIERAPFVQKRNDPETVRATAIARNHGASLVVDVSATTRKAIRDTVARGIRENWPIPRVAKALRDVVGLHARYANAVTNMRSRLEKKAGMSSAKIDKAVGAYREKLLRSRALTIARTETAFAENQTRHERWLQEANKGELDPTFHRTWIVGDPCPLCREISLMPPVPLAMPFQTPVGPLLYPPAHPRCKCTVGLVKLEGNAAPKFVGGGLFRRLAQKARSLRRV